MVISFFFALVLQAETRPVLQPLAADDLDVRLYCDQREFLVGEPLDLTVIVENVSKRLLEVPYFDFGTAGIWGKVFISLDGQVWNQEWSAYPCSGGFHSFSLIPGQTKHFPIHLNSFLEASHVDQGFEIRVTIELHPGAWEIQDLPAKPGDPLPELKHLTIESVSRKSSNGLSLRVSTPSTPDDVRAYEILLTKAKEGPFGYRGIGLPEFGSLIHPEGMAGCPQSRYAVHGRFSACRSAITNAIRNGNTVPDIPELLDLIAASELGFLEDNALQWTYLYISRLRGFSSEQLIPLRTRLMELHSDLDGYQEAKARGLL